MKIDNNLKLSFMLTIFAVGMRVYQKLFAISAETGFYNSTELHTPILLIIMAAAIYFARKELLNKEQIMTTKKSSLLGALSLFMSAATAYDTYAFVFSLSEERIPLVPTSPLIYDAFILTGILSVVALLFLAKGHFKGEVPNKPYAVIVLVALWQAFRSISVFGYFSQVTTVSDNLLESFFMMAVCLMTMNLAYTLAGYEKRNYNTALYISITAIVGVPLVVGQLASMITGGAGNIGPTFASCLVIASYSAYGVILMREVLTNASCDN